MEVARTQLNPLLNLSTFHQKDIENHQSITRSPELMAVSAIETLFADANLRVFPYIHRNSYLPVTWRLFSFICTASIPFFNSNICSSIRRIDKRLIRSDEPLRAKRHWGNKQCSKEKTGQPTAQTEPTDQGFAKSFSNNCRPENCFQPPHGTTPLCPKTSITTRLSHPWIP